MLHGGCLAMVLRLALGVSSASAAADTSEPPFHPKEGAFVLKLPADRESPCSGAQLADLNGDAALDIVAVLGGPKGGIHVYLNRKGAFVERAGAVIPFPQCHGCRIADVDNDGAPDLIAFVRGGDLNVYRNVGGEFGDQPHRRIVIDGGAGGCLAGDFDGDGKIDLVVSVKVGGLQGGCWQVLLGKDGLDPAKAIVKAEYGLRLKPLTWHGRLCDDSVCDFLAGPRWVALLPNRSLSKGYFLNWREGYANDVATVADLDGEGSNDLLVTQRAARSVATHHLYLFYGPFALPPEPRNWGYGFTIGPVQACYYTEIPLGPLQRVRPPAVADFNGDGRLDILVQAAQKGVGWQTLIYRQNQPMGFESEDPPTAVLAGASDLLQAVDLNKDGFCDLVSYRSGRVRVFLNRDGHLPADASAPDQALALRDTVRCVTSVDLDGDTWPDLVVRCARWVRVYLNRWGTAAKAQ